MRLNRILLVNPPILTEHIYGRYAVGAPTLPPLGLCHIASVLLAAGREVRLRDFAVERAGWAAVEKAIKEFQPQLLGVSANTVSFHSARQVLSLAKRIDRGIITVLGGAHISALPLQTLQECPDLDIGVCGEGEATIVELLAALESGGPLAEVAGLSYREGGRERTSSARPLIADLDSLPSPARNLLGDMRRYLPNPFRGFGHGTSLLSSRGCPGTCAYCSQAVYSRTWRARGADHIAAEMADLRARYGFDFFSFEDDNFLVDRGRIAALCQKLLAARLGVSWTCSARVGSFDREVLRLMRQAGCRMVYLGIESGSDRVRANLAKPTTLSAIRESVALLKENALGAYGSFMIGTPGETASDIESTLDLALSLPLDAVSVFLYVPYPGTPLREQALRLGYVSTDWRDYAAYPTRPPFVGAGLTAEFLLTKQRELHRRFYLRPRQIATHLPALLRLGVGRLFR